jgi:hypothetical protein
MEKQRTLSREELLLGARKESLSRINQTSLRSHGKLWGMDVFSWIHPNVTTLNTTIISFPFPVKWVANKVDVVNALDQQSDLCAKVAAVFLFDSSVFSLKDEHVLNLKYCVGTTCVTEAMSMVKIADESPSILLFTASGDSAESANIEFEQILKVLQGK